MAETLRELRIEALQRVAGYDRATQRVLNKYIREVDVLAKRFANDIPRFRREVDALFNRMYVDFATVSVTQNAAMASVVATYVDATLVTALRDAGARRTAAAIGRSSDGYAERIGNLFMSRRHPADGRTFSSRIVTLQRGSETVVDRLIELGIRRGNSVNDIARAIQGYIDPSSPGGRRVTAGNGVNYRMVPTNKKIPKGSIKYNAVRIARSEVMQTYDAAMAHYYDNKAWSGGWNWRLSNTHKVFDTCDELVGYHKTLPERPHPQCTCDPQPVVPSMDEFAKLVAQGKIA